MTDLSAFRDYVNSLDEPPQRVKVYDMPEQPAPAEPAADGWLSEHGIALVFIVGGVLWALLWWLD